MKPSPRAALPAAIVVLIVVFVLFTLIGRDLLFVALGFVFAILAAVATYLGVDHRSRAEVQTDDYFAQVRGQQAQITALLDQVEREADAGRRYMRRLSQQLLAQGLADVRTVLDRLMSHQQDIGDLQMQLEKWYEQVLSLSTLIHFFAEAAPDPDAYPGADEALKQVDPAIATFAGTARDAVRLANQGQMAALTRSAALLSPLSVTIPAMPDQKGGSGG